ncbi:MAG: outer membrane protein [Gammaproteobacteria bacterium]
MKIQHRVLALLTALAMSGPVWANAGYVRGDFAYSWALDNQATQTSLVGYPATTANYDLQISPVPLGQLGFGYQVNPYVRFDLTGALTGSREANVDCSNSSSACLDAHSAGLAVDTSTLFVNAYYELASLWTKGTKGTKDATRWHPYIGVGLGSAYQYMSGTNVPISVNGTSYLLDVDSNGQWQFAWRGMAGLAVTLADNLLLDMSYVYMGAGQAESGTAAQFGPGGSVQLQEPMTMDMNVQEVYVGLRQYF